jgi:hypothetical protein
LNPARPAPKSAGFNFEDKKMSIKEPGISVCVDGDTHSWMIVAEDNSQGDGLRLEKRWCEKCGCLTQVCIGSDNEPVVALSEDGSPHLVIPEILAALTN